MPNLYADLQTFKSKGWADIQTSDYDALIMGVLEDASRQIDKDTERFFYIYEGTFYQDGGATRVVLDWDVQTISTMKVDTGGDSQWADTYTVDIQNVTTAPDAYAYPTNTLPKTRLEANPFGSYGHLGATFRKAIKLTGTFGYGNDWPTAYYHTTSVITGADLTSTAAILYLKGNSTSEIATGNTLYIGSEQIFVYGTITGDTNSTCPITRAVNGTTAGTPTASTAIAVYDYPKPIVTATLIEAFRLWKRRESAFATRVGNMITGEYEVYKGADADYSRAIQKYKRERIGKWIN